MEQSISQEVQERLNNINWESLKEKYGISRSSLTPLIASQLAYGQLTDLIPAHTEEISGMFSLRAYPQGEGQEWKVKLYTIEKAKSPNETMYLYNQPIPDKVRDTLLERTSWIGNDGSRKFGLANANGGRPVTITIDGEKEKFLVSIHQPTNRVVGIPVEQVKSYFLEKDGELRGKGMYGVKFTEEQATALAEGNPVRLEGCRGKDGETFVCYVQFDAAQRQTVPCHPTWLKEAEKTGTDLGLKQPKAQEKAKERKAEPVEQKPAKRTPKMR